MFQVGQTVYSVNTRYGCRYRYGQATTVCGVRGDYVLAGGYWHRADRFSATQPKNLPNAVPYDIQGFYGCCGACIVYFGGVVGTKVDPERLEATDNRARSLGYGTMVGILNYLQEKRNGEILRKAGWQRVGVSASRYGATTPLYTYHKAIKEAHSGSIVEVARSFA